MTTTAVFRSIPGPSPSVISGKLEKRTREHLTEQEVAALMAAASKVGRHGHRDAAIILLAYRHGLRCGELVSLKWAQVDFASATLHVVRLKRGTPATHPLDGASLRALRRLQRESEGGPFIFLSSRGGPLTTSLVRKMIARAGRLSGFPFLVHPHMLRHACGYALVNRGVDVRLLQGYLGHRNVQHTVRYAELAPGRFRGVWND